MKNYYYTFNDKTDAEIFASKAGQELQAAEEREGEYRGNLQGPVATNGRPGPRARWYVHLNLVHEEQAEAWAVDAATNFEDSFQCWGPNR